jgi:hypothetical protein
MGLKPSTAAQVSQPNDVRRAVGWLRRTTMVASSAAIVIFGTAGNGAVAFAGSTTEHYSFSDTYVQEDCGFPVEVTFESSGLYQVKNDGRELDNYSWRIVETNPANGKWFVRSGNGMSQDITMTLVEGTIYRFVAIHAGRTFTVWNMDGERLFFDRGLSMFTFLLDTKGDADPSNDEVIEDSVELLRQGGSHDAEAYFSEHDWCEFVQDLIG